MLEQLREKNPTIHIYSVNDPEFSLYGEVLDSDSFDSFLNYLKQETVVPEEGNVYQAHCDQLKNLSMQNQTIDDIFGSVTLEYGYVNGNNTKLNAMEFHKSSEINVMATPLILLLATLSDITEHGLDSSRVKAFYIPEDTVVEVYGTTLHFSPCKVDDAGFKCGVILPYGTNMEFVKSRGSSGKYSKYLFKTNKWLLNHPENKRMSDLGAHVGITGENIEIAY